MRDRQEFQGNELYKGRRYKITWVRRKKQDSFPKIIHFYSPKEWKKKQPDFSFSNLLDPTTGLDSHVRVLYCSSIFQHSVHGINDIWNNNESNPSFRLCLLVILNFLIFNFFTARGGREGDCFIARAHAGSHLDFWTDCALWRWK